MKVLSVSQFSQDELVSSLRSVRLRGFDATEVYGAAQIEVAEALNPRLATPAQNYVLRENVTRVGQLRVALAQWGVDPLGLAGGAHITTSDDPSRIITVIPPIVEESTDADGRECLLVCDGLHRLYYALVNDLPVTAVVVRGASQPYYAYPLADGWAGVALLDSLPDGHQKKDYRQPGNYKALFRDFNGVFPNVQTQRARSNPAHLQPGSFEGDVADVADEARQDP